MNLTDTVASIFPAFTEMDFEMSALRNTEEKRINFPPIRIQVNQSRELAGQPAEFERQSVECVDEYSRLHDEIAALWIEADNHPVLSVEREAIRKQIDELRGRAYQEIPYGATTPNKGWNGKRR